MQKVISVCKKNRDSTWGNGTPRKTSAGMKMVVEVTKEKGKNISKTKYISG